MSSKSSTTKRLTPSARAALYAVCLFLGGHLVHQAPESGRIPVLTLGAFLLLGLGIFLFWTSCHMRLHRACEKHSTPFIHPRLLPGLNGLLLSLAPILWALLLYHAPNYDTASVLRIGILFGAYLTIGLFLLRVCHAWLGRGAAPLSNRGVPLLSSLLLAALLATTGQYLLLRYTHLQVQQAQAALEDRATLLLDLMENSVRVHLHNNRYMPDRLHEAFDAMSNVAYVLGARLFTRDGMVIVEGWPLDTESPFEDALYSREDVYLQTRSAQLDLDSHPLGMGMRGGRGMRGGPGGGPGGGGGGGAGTGQGPQAWRPFPPGPHQLLIVLDRSPVDASREAAYQNSLLGLLAVYVVALIAVGLGRSRYRRLDLESSLLAAQEQSAHLERLAQMGAGLAHETKNPLGLVRGLAQSIADSATDHPAVQRQARDIVDESDRIVGQINRFLKLARPDTPRLETIALHSFMANLETLVRQESQDRGLALQMTSNVQSIEGDPEQLRQLLLNLILNAFAACAPGDSVSVRAEPASGEVDRAILEVIDSGCGIDPADLDKVRQPYFTRFPGGTGLGLALVEEIARNHGWRIDIASEPDRGTTISIHGLKAVR